MDAQVPLMCEEHNMPERSVEKVVFIDIDGVLLPNRMWAAAENIDILERAVPPVQRAPLLRFDPGAVGLLVRLCRLSGAKLVLSSSWRTTWPHGLASLRDKLASEGLDQELWHERWTLAPDITAIEGALENWLAQAICPVHALSLNDRHTAALKVKETGRIRIAEINPNIDDGFGLAEYRAGLKYLGASDERVPAGRIADTRLLSDALRSPNGEPGDHEKRVLGQA